jgi:putative acetyltransferase
MSSSKTLRTDSTSPDFQSLVRHLDEELAAYNGTDNEYYSSFNKIENIKHALVVYSHEVPVGCGAIKEYSSDAAEVKRMYVNREIRGKGTGKIILDELEKWALELNYNYLILETGSGLEAAVGLYLSSGFEIIPNYGQYINMDKSICFKKKINNLSP